jgi:hypothetical protein
MSSAENVAAAVVVAIVAAVIAVVLERVSRRQHQLFCVRHVCFLPCPGRGDVSRVLWALSCEKTNVLRQKHCFLRFRVRTEAGPSQAAENMFLAISRAGDVSTVSWASTSENKCSVSAKCFLIFPGGTETGPSQAAKQTFLRQKRFDFCYFQGE